MKIFNFITVKLYHFIWSYLSRRCFRCSCQLKNETFVNVSSLCYLYIKKTQYMDTVIDLKLCHTSIKSQSPINKNWIYTIYMVSASISFLIYGSIKMKTYLNALTPWYMPINYPDETTRLDQTKSNTNANRHAGYIAYYHHTLFTHYIYTELIRCLLFQMTGA